MCFRPPRWINSLALLGLVVLVSTSVRAPFAAADDVELTPTAQAPSPAFLAWATAETESDTGAGTVSSGSSGDPFTFAEESGYAFSDDEFIRLSFYAYSFSHAAKNCASYSVEFSFDISSEGPNTENRFVALFDSDDTPLFGEGVPAPAVGDTDEVGFEVDVDAEDLRGGLVVNYGAVTGTRDVGSGTTSGAGFTFGAPTVILHEDGSSCPAPTTTTTTTTTTTSTVPPPVDPLVVSDPRPSVGDTITVSGNGFMVRSTVVVSVAGVDVARPMADDSGAFEVSVGVPESTSGSFEVVASGVDPDGDPRVMRTTITTSPADPPATTSSPAPRRLVAAG